MLTGKHLVAGQWIGGEKSFVNEPLDGQADAFAVGTAAHVDQAVQGAEEAFWSFGYSERSVRAAFLRKIADEIDVRGTEITAMGIKETGLPKARLEGERGRTTSQLKLFASHIETGDYLDRRHDVALQDRAPLPRPELHMMQRPIGPVAVFGASNFPLAFSTAGGDTAAAFAAGCPVVVKGHSAHPGVSELVAQAIDAARVACDLHPGVFSQIQGGDRTVGQALVQHPLIKAVGFTGSVAGGRALFDLCASRPEPIPFFGELGSINPMFILPDAMQARSEVIAQGWAASLTMGAGQFCTNPGVAVVIEGSDADKFAAAAARSLGDIDAQTMLTEGIAFAYNSGRERIEATNAVRTLHSTTCNGRQALPNLYQTSAQEWLANDDLSEEVFGPLGVIVIARDFDEVLAIAKDLHGQLTCTLHIDDDDLPEAQKLLPILERKAGRVLANGFPTGVEVCDTMVHGGPYPASTNFGATSVGTMAIRRFLRPVCYQNLPQTLVPNDLN
ncbi:MAG: aldehyde dehydrogenase (NADP(+)) [Cognatishimia sp.]